MKLAILIDACTDQTFLYLIKDKKIVLDQAKYDNNKDLSYKLSEYLFALVSKNNFEIEDINQLFLVTGPGKFSGMRIGSVAVKLWKMIFPITLYICNRFDYLAEDDSIVVIEADGKKFFYCQYIDGKRYTTPTLVDHKQLHAFLKQYKKTKVIYDTDKHDFSLAKLAKFKVTNEDFILEYFKPAC